MLLAQCEADLPFMHDIQHECFGLAHAMAEPNGCPLGATPMGGVPPHQLGEQWTKREQDWAELGAPLGQHKRTAHQATSGFYCVAGMQNDTIFGVHCLPFLLMTSSASSLLDPHDFVPAKPMP